MERFAFMTRKEIKELKRVLRKKGCISVYVSLPETCYKTKAVLTIQKSIFTYQLLLDTTNYSFSENKSFRTFVNRGYMSFYHYDLLIDFFKDLQKSYPLHYKKVHKVHFIKS